MARHGAQWRVVARGHLVHLHHAAHSTPYTAQMQHRRETGPALLVLPCVPGAARSPGSPPPLGLSLAGASLSPRAGSCGDRRARSPGCSSTAVNTPFEIPIICAALGDGLRGAARGDRIAPGPLCVETVQHVGQARLSTKIPVTVYKDSVDRLQKFPTAAGQGWRLSRSSSSNTDASSAAKNRSSPLRCSVASISASTAGQSCGVWPLCRS